MVSEQLPTSSSRFNRKKENIFARLINAIRQSTTKQKVKYLVLGLGLVTLVIVCLYLYGLSKSNNISSNQQSVSRVCNENMSNKVIDTMKSGEVVSKEVANSVTALPNYNNDPDCLYILSVVYSQNSEVDKAREVLAKLYSMKYSDIDVNPNFSSVGFISKESVNKYIDVYQKKDESRNRNTHYISPPKDLEP